MKENETSSLWTDEAFVEEFDRRVRAALRADRDGRDRFAFTRDERYRAALAEDPPKTPAKILGQKFIDALIEHGVVDSTCRRVIIDAEVGKACILYYETIGTDRLVEIVAPAVGDTLIREFAPDPEGGGQLVEIVPGGRGPGLVGELIDEPEEDLDVAEPDLDEAAEAELAPDDSAA